VSAILQWTAFVLPPFASAYVTLFVWGKSSSMGYSLVSGTLAGVILMLVLSLLFWSGTDLCEQCQLGTN
jgi:hypothetical protein